MPTKALKKGAIITLIIVVIIKKSIEFTKGFNKVYARINNSEKPDN
jgi:hypothetical protein